jgi:hypothetical protein
MDGGHAVIPSSNGGTQMSNHPAGALVGNQKTKGAVNKSSM